MNDIEWAKVLSKRIDIFEDKVEKVIDDIESILKKVSDKKNIDKEPNVYLFNGEPVVYDNDVCQFLNINPRTTRRYREKGFIKYLCMGRTIIYPLKEYEKIKHLVARLKKDATANNLPTSHR